MTLEQLLANSEAFDWRMMVYTSPPPRTFEPQTEVLVLSNFDLAEDEIPVEASERGMVEFLTVDQVADIFAALARTGTPDPTPEQRLTAFRYYVEYDAFIDPAKLS